MVTFSAPKLKHIIIATCQWVKLSYIMHQSSYFSRFLEIAVLKINDIVKLVLRTIAIYSHISQYFLSLCWVYASGICRYILNFHKNHMGQKMCFSQVTCQQLLYKSTLFPYTQLDTCIKIMKIKTHPRIMDLAPEMWLKMCSKNMHICNLSIHWYVLKLHFKLGKMKPKLL